MLKYALAVLLCVGLCGNVAAGEMTEDDAAFLKALPENAAICSAFFTVAAQCTSKNNPDTSTRMDRLALQCLAISQRLSDTELTKNRFEFYAKDMMKQINNDCGRFAILMNEHLHPCQEMFQRIERITKKIQQMD